MKTAYQVVAEPESEFVCSYPNPYAGRGPAKWGGSDTLHRATCPSLNRKGNTAHSYPVSDAHAWIAENEHLFDANLRHPPKICNRCCSDMVPKTATRKQAASISGIQQALNSKEFYLLLAEIFGIQGNGATHGGCLVVALGLQKVFGGEIMAMINDRSGAEGYAQYIAEGHSPMVEHYVVKVGGQYLDGDGAHGDEILIDDEYGGFAKIPNLFIPATPDLIADARYIQSPMGAADMVAEFIRENT